MCPGADSLFSEWKWVPQLQNNLRIKMIILSLSFLVIILAGNMFCVNTLYQKTLNISSGNWNFSILFISNIWTTAGSWNSAIQMTTKSFSLLDCASKCQDRVTSSLGLCNSFKYYSNGNCDIGNVGFWFSTV